MPIKQGKGAAVDPSEKTMSGQEAVVNIASLSRWDKGGPGILEPKRKKKKLKLNLSRYLRFPALHGNISHKQAFQPIGQPREDR